MIITVDIPFDFGDIVYLKTDSEQHPRIVTAVINTIDGGLLIELMCGIVASKHYVAEISEEKNQAITI